MPFIAEVKQCLASQAELIPLVEEYIKPWGARNMSPANSRRLSSMARAINANMATIYADAESRLTADMQALYTLRTQNEAWRKITQGGAEWFFNAMYSVAAIARHYFYIYSKRRGEVAGTIPAARLIGGYKALHAFMLFASISGYDNADLTAAERDRGFYEYWLMPLFRAFCAENTAWNWAQYVPPNCAPYWVHELIEIYNRELSPQVVFPARGVVCPWNWTPMMPYPIGEQFYKFQEVMYAPPAPIW